MAGAFDWGPIRTAFLRADSDRCLRLLEAAPRPEALIWQGVIDVREGRYANAITTLLRVRPEDLRLRAERDVWLARCYANTGECSMAQAFVERALSNVHPPNRTAYRAIYARALAYYLSRQYEDAETAIDQLIKCDDAEYRAQAHALRGWVAARHEDLRTQIDCLTRCFAEYENVSEPLQYVFAHALVAFAALCREMPIAHVHERVRRAFERVPQTNGIAGAYFQLTRIFGWIDALQGDELSALRFWREAEQSAPSDFWCVFCLVDRAYLARVSGRSQQAEEALAQAHDQASRLNWNQTRDEERIILLTIAQLSLRSNQRSRNGTWLFSAPCRRKWIRESDGTAIAARARCNCIRRALRCCTSVNANCNRDAPRSVGDFQRVRIRLARGACRARPVSGDRRTPLARARAPANRALAQKLDCTRGSPSGLAISCPVCV